MKNRHAYLIMAHGDFALLEKQLQLFDDVRNDVYIHIDKKVKDFDFEYFSGIVKKAGVYFTERTDVVWGDYSQINCELLLLKAALPGRYAYYHLLSGVDLPLKTQDEIHHFFQMNNGAEFVHFCTAEQAAQKKNRVLHFHLIKWCRTKSKKFNSLASRVNNALERLQEKTGFERKWNKNTEIRYGANWFSITHALAEYVVGKEWWIKKHFRYSACGDELFLQTVVYNSEFRDMLYLKTEETDTYAGCMRLIDWKRGTPYVFRKEDFSFLAASEMMFARKFGTAVDCEIIDALCEHLNS